MPCRRPASTSSMNESYRRGGKLRFALGALKNVGEKANGNSFVIRAPRQRAVTCLDHLAERIDSACSTAAAFESLAAAGSFDSSTRFGPPCSTVAETILAHAEQTSTNRGGERAGRCCFGGDSRTGHADDFACRRLNAGRFAEG